jgi:hypothetical protein
VRFAALLHASSVEGRLLSYSCSLILALLSLLSSHTRVRNDIWAASEVLSRDLLLEARRDHQAA